MKSATRATRAALPLVLLALLLAACSSPGPSAGGSVASVEVLFTASPPTIHEGESSDLTWQFIPRDANGQRLATTQLAIDQALLMPGNINVKGLASYKVTPVVTTTYVLTVAYRGGSSSMTTTVTVQRGSSPGTPAPATNEPPAFTGQPITGATQGVGYDYLITAEDPNPGDALSFSAIRLPGWLTLKDNGNRTATLAGTPTKADVGEAQVAVRVTDAAGLSATLNFVLRVVNTNDKPAFTSSPVTKATQGKPYAYAVTAEDKDPGDALVITAPTKPAWLELVDNGGGSATLSGTPGEADVTDAVQVELRVTDSKGAASQQTFTLQVLNVNDNPRITSTPTTSALQGKPYVYDVAFDDPDPGDVLKLDVTGPSWLTWQQTGSKTGKITFTPLTTHVGQHQITLTVTDGNGGKTTQPYTLTVTDEPDAPVAKAIPNQGYTFSLDLNDYFSDPDGDKLSYTVVMDPDAAWLPRNPSGGILKVQVPPNQINKTFKITVVGKDPSNKSASATFDLKVTCPKGTLYVDKSASGLGSGLTWANAFTELQTPLAWARACPDARTIHIAEGIYYPTDGYATFMQVDDDGYLLRINPKTSGQSDEASFYITEGIKLIGGFTKGGGSRGMSGGTVLSGDIDQNDRTTGNRTLHTNDIVGVNSKRILVIDGGDSRTNVTAATVIDGIAVTGGTAGAILCNGTGPGNECSAKLTGLTVIGNRGGLLFRADVEGKANPTIKFMSVIGNSIYGVAFQTKGTVLTAVTLQAQERPKTAQYFDVPDYKGGSINATITNIELKNNEAYGSYDGAIVAFCSNYHGALKLQVVNALITDNRGVGVNVEGRDCSAFVSIINSTFAKNNNVVTLSGFSSGGAQVNVYNSIVWDNQIYVDSSNPEGRNRVTFDYSLLQVACQPSEGVSVEVVCGNQLITSPTYPFIGANNYQLAYQSPALDRGSNQLIQQTSVDIDLSGKARIARNIVDLGPYEAQ